MKSEIYCDCCKKLIPYSDVVYGDAGNYFCEQCFIRPTRNKLFSENKRDFYKDRQKWNDYAKQVNAVLDIKYRPVAISKPFCDELIGKTYNVS